jgi:hypothetical protein
MSGEALVLSVLDQILRGPSAKKLCSLSALSALSYPWLRLASGLPELIRRRHSFIPYIDSQD